jgi:hypothetical protein
MIKATGNFDGRPVIMLGLSRANLNKFMAEMGDTYILIKREQIGIERDILIFSGETEAEMAEMMKGGIGPDTLIHEDRDNQ